MGTKVWTTAEKITLIVVAVCGLLMVAALYLWAAPCTGAMELANGNAAPMRCAYTTKVAVVMALMLVVLALSSLIFRTDLRIALLVVALGCILVTFDSALGIGVCKKEMACWTSALWVRLLAGASIVSTIASYVIARSFKKPQL